MRNAEKPQRHLVWIVVIFGLGVLFAPLGSLAQDVKKDRHESDNSARNAQQVFSETSVSVVSYNTLHGKFDFQRMK